MISKIFCVSESIAHTHPILIEASVSEKGLPTFEIYGLVSKSIEESKKRVVTAFESSGIPFPLKNIKVNIAPANISKDGTHFDLAIAYLILESSLSQKLPENSVLLGELSFDGSVSKLENIFYLSLKAIEQGVKNLFIPMDSVNLVENLEGVNIFPVNHLTDLLKIEEISKAKKSEIDLEDSRDGLNFRSILGNNLGKKILQYSLIGGHHFLLEGFPGVGKSMLVKSIGDLVPKLNPKDAVVVSKIHSYLGINRNKYNFLIPPFRSPHQSSSYSAVLGSFGNKIYPGEIALANKGILFLDEMPEFNRLVLEGLRAPLEDKRISISRLKNKIDFDTDFILAGTRNPCKCGYFNHPKINCKCSPFEIKKYQNRISGPIIDRLDIYFKVQDNKNQIDKSDTNYCSFEEYQTIRDKIPELKKSRGMLILKQNSDVKSPLETSTNLHINSLPLKSRELLDSVKNNYSLSNRSIQKVLNLSLTIAVFNKREVIQPEDVLEALSYRYISS